MEQVKNEIGVIMSVYNEEPKWLRAAIESILSQTYKTFRYYILLDHPDNDVLKEIIEEYQKKDERILFYQNVQNIGLVYSLNKLIGLVEEPYIARMDADDIACPERLEKELRFLKKHKLDFVVTGADYLDEDGNITPGDAIPNLSPRQVAQSSKYGNVAIHSSWLLKKKIYLKLEGYRNCQYCEDYDLVLRALQKHTRIGRMEEHLQQYRVRNSSITLTHALEQDEKVKFLMKSYRHGKQITDLDVEKLNQRFEAVTDRQRQKYSQAKHQVDQIAQYLYQKELRKCFYVFLSEFLKNRYFRTLFFTKFLNKIRLERIYGQG